MARFNIAREGQHLVIKDTDGRPVVAFLPNDRKPESPRIMAEICVKALNEADEKWRKK